MSFRSPLATLQGYYERKSASLVFRREFWVEPKRPVISFTFDDFPRSALTTGGTILNHFGLAGTYYASLGLTGKETVSGEIFQPEDLSLLFDQGHELGCHTFSHCDSWETEPDQYERSVLENRAALDKLAPGAQFASFAYPISLPRPRSKGRIAGYFLSCRAGGQRINLGNTDLNQLSAYFLEKSRDHIQAVRDLIDHNRRSNGWLIFATHDVSDNPTRVGCNPQFFEDVVRYSVASGAQVVPVVEALAVLGAPGCERARLQRNIRPRVAAAQARVRREKRPLVSIVIPAYNSAEWIANTIRSACAQTWDKTEVIVVDDGSKDDTYAIARRFESPSVRVVRQPNQGAAAARNTAIPLCQGDYIQWLDADDLLAPDKIERQIESLGKCRSKRTLLSAGYGKFLHRWEDAEFNSTALWQTLSPAEWLTRKMEQNLFMQTGTWLVSRELTEAAGPWDTRLLSDDDGEYFCRVLMASDEVFFVPESRMYYRGPGIAFAGSLSFIGRSERKLRAHWISMQLHIGYLRSMADTERTRAACLKYLQTCFIYFYPEMTDIVKEVEDLARELGGRLATPRLSWKYHWVQKSLGWGAAKRLQVLAPRVRWRIQKTLNQALSPRSTFP